VTAAAKDTRFGTSLPLPIQKRLRMQALLTRTKIAQLIASLLDQALMSEAELAAAMQNGDGDERAD
jgi:hypothetical protein